MPDAALLPDADALLVPLLELLLLLPQASRISVAIPAAPPVRAVRRVIWRQRLNGLSSSLRSSHSRRSTASWMRSSSAIWVSSLLGDARSSSSRTLSQTDAGVDPP
jgi:hypothetical protein